MEDINIFQNETALLLVTSKALKEFGINIANEILSGQKKPPAIQGPEKPIPSRDAEIFLNKSRQTLYTLRRKGVIKGYRLGGRIYYKPSELVAALEGLK